MLIRLSRFAVVSLVFAVWLGGCSRPSGPELVLVEGVITLDGEPVPNGQVLLSDPTLQDQTYAGEIRNGGFSFSSTPGSKRVSITSPQVVPGAQGARGGIEGDPVGPENPAVVIQEIIPVRYNDQSELTIEVVANGGNHFPFELKSE